MYYTCIIHVLYMYYTMYYTCTKCHSEEHQYDFTYLIMAGSWSRIHFTDIS